VRIHCAGHATPDTLYPQKLALTSPTSGGRSVDRYSSLADYRPLSFFSSRLVITTKLSQNVGTGNKIRSFIRIKINGIKILSM
jgi:hypothetical protein